MPTTKRDFRSLSEDTQAELRRLAFTHLDKGKTRAYIATIIEVNIQTIADWVRKRSELEQRNYTGKKRGRIFGEGRTLTEKEETAIKTMILEKTPVDIGLGSALWTRRKVQELLKKETGHFFILNTVGKHLHRWGLTAQRPGKIAHEQDMKKIVAWIDEEYPKIESLAQEEDAIIKFSDETGISMNTYYGKTYAPIGKTPSIKLPAVRTHISMISSISNQGLSEFMLYKGGLDSTLFLMFLKKQIKDSKKKIFLIVDNLRVHKSKVVMEWVKKHEDKITLFFPTTVRSTIQPSRVIKQHLQARYAQKLLS